MAQGSILSLISGLVSSQDGSMKLTLQIQVLPDAEQTETLLATMERFNAAANFAAEVGFEAGVFSQPSIHERCYKEIRERFGLSAQMAVRAIGKAVEAFKRDKTIRPEFRPRGAVTYDQRILSFKGLDKVSLWTVTGRMILPIAFGEYQGERFDRMKGQVDLVYRDGRFYLYATIAMPEGAPIEIKDFLGVDPGIVNIATTSDGTTHPGAEEVRRRHLKGRRRYQGERTGGAREAPQRQRRREARSRRHRNHVISKAIVAAAEGTGRGIALGGLKGIRDRTTVRAKRRARHAGWASFRPRSFVEYKAKLAGAPAVSVDPRNTSRTCNAGGHRDQADRRSQSEFVCPQRHHATNADLNAARNLRDRARGTSKMPPELVSLRA
jgi:putative transposase